MVHNELHAIDLGIIAAYLIAMVAIGVVVVKKVQSTDDYYLGGRSFGPLVLMATVCATIIGGSGLMGRAGVAYSSGFKAIMTALPYLLGMFIFSGFAGRISAVGTTFMSASSRSARRMVSGETLYSGESLERPEILSPSFSCPEAIRSANEMAIRVYCVRPSLSIAVTPLPISK